MGYSLKNARFGKSASKIPKWPGLRFLALKSKFIIARQFEFSEKLEDVAGEQPDLQQIFPYKSSYSLKNSACHNFSFFNDGVSNLAILALMGSFHFWHSSSYSP